MNAKFIISLLLSVIGPTTAATASQKRIPIKLVDHLILIQAVVDGKTGNFILDTGTSNLVLNSRYFQGEPISKAFQGINGRTKKVAHKFSRVEIGGNGILALCRIFFRPNTVSIIFGVLLPGMLIT